MFSLRKIQNITLYETMNSLIKHENWLWNSKKFKSMIDAQCTMNMKRFFEMKT